MLKALVLATENEIRELDREINDEFDLMVRIFESQDQEPDLRKFMQWSKDEVFDKMVELYLKRKILSTLREASSQSQLAETEKGKESYDMPHPGKVGAVQ